MADVHEPDVRSYNMSQIKGKNTKPEMLVRRFLHANGFRYRIHVGSLPGKPDIVLKKHKTVIFINGCFWHGHKGCKYYLVPKTRTQWWIEKIDRNKEKDKESNIALQQGDWNVITIWECELKRGKREKTLENMKSRINE